MEWTKLSTSLGSGMSDPVTSGAAVQSVPSPVVGNKPAPGMTGPKGLSPRTSYTRVNTGAPPVPDAGASGQKGMSPRGMEFLPTKVAHQEKDFMTTTLFATPSLHDLVKEALEGTISKVDVSAEANRQLANVGQQLPERVKTASVDEEEPEHLSTEYIHKLASALDYMVKQADAGVTKIQPGKGPNALEVLEATSSEENVQPGGQGQAKTQIPLSPPMQSSGVAKDPSNAMETNDSMMHGEQPVDPMHNEKSAAALLQKNLMALGLEKEARPSFPAERAAKAAREALIRSRGGLKGEAFGRKMLGGGLGVGGAAGGAAGYFAGKKSGSGDEKSKAASAADETRRTYARNLMALGLFKQAEDALSPAKISAGSTQTGETPPEGASAAGEQVPSEPSDVNSQKRMIASNEAATNYTKREAKADPKKDVGHVVDEPALSAATDTTLKKTLDHTNEAGAKIASDLMKTAAATALLSKLAADAHAPVKKKTKEKNSMGGTLDTPSGQSGFQASGSGPAGM